MWTSNKSKCRAQGVITEEGAAVSGTGPLVGVTGVSQWNIGGDVCLDCLLDKTTDKCTLPARVFRLGGKWMVLFASWTCRSVSTWPGVFHHNHRGQYCTSFWTESCGYVILMLEEPEWLFVWKWNKDNIRMKWITSIILLSFPFVHNPHCVYGIHDNKHVRAYPSPLSSWKQEIKLPAHRL